MEKRSMKAVVCKAYGPPESLSHGEFPMPVAGAGQVLIKVAAAGVNFLDTLIIEGKYQDRPALPFVPGSEAAGVVVEVGAGVSGFAVGDRVLAMQGWNAYAEYMAVNATGQVFHLPASMDFVTAAGFGIAYSTSLYGLRQKAHLAAGETLLVLAAGSGVGLTAVELGAMMGARVIAAASSSEKLERARQAGASETINYRQESLKPRVMEITGGRGVDVVYDPVGGDFFDAAVRTLAWNGRLLVVGFASGRIPALPANLLLLKGISAIGVLAGGFQKNEPELQQANLEDLLRWYAQGKLHPQVSRTAPLAQAAQMLTAIARGEVQGKVVLTCSEPIRPAVMAPLETQTMSDASKLAPGEDGNHITHCRLCDAYCGLVATVKKGRITKVMPDKDNVVSRGFLCPKGPAMAAIAHDPDRVLHPLKRSGAAGEFTRVSWDEALGDIAQRLGAIHQAQGGEAIAMYVGNPAAAATFTNHIAAGLLKSLGSSLYYTPAAADTTQRWVATEAVYGQPVLPIPDLPNCDFLLVIAANPLESHGSLLTSPRIRDDMDAIAARGRVVVIDPRKTKTAARYEHVPILPNTDVYLLIGMLRVLFGEHLADQDFLQNHVKGWEILSAACTSFSVEQCARFCGIEVPTIRGLARRLAAPRAVCYSRIGICRASFGTLTNVLVEALNIVAGRFGQPGGWGFGFDPYVPAGASPRRRRPTYARTRSRSGGFPSIAGTLPATVLADDISHASEHPIRALIVVAGNPARSYPEGDKLEAALQTLDLHV
ncbi:MAG: zinc-binding dehydrogenase, partial [Sulfuricaulis sp.]|nr:zinc-binding dehydrogenase [Sulfuricaulis sp.]